MMENLYFFEGLDADGNPIRVENLTFKEAQELQKQEDEGKKARASDAALAPGLNADIGRYAKAKGLDKGQLGPGSDMSAQGGGMPAAPATALSDMPTTAPADADPVIGGLDKMASSREDTTQLESVLKNIPPPRATAVSEMRPGVVETTQAQPKGSIQTLLDNLPPEIAQTLLFQYRNDPKTMTPSKLLSEIRKANEEMAAIRRGQEAEKFKTDETIRGGAPDRASKEAMNAEDNATQLKIAGIQAASQKASSDAKNAYSERTVMLKPPQVELITNYDNSMNAIDVIRNTFSDKYVGVAKGRFGSVKQFLGQLGPEESIFRTAIAEYQNELLKLRSGAAVTESEYNRFKKEVADVNSSPEQFSVILDRQRRYLENKKTTTLKNWRKVGYNLGDFEYEIGDVDTYSPGSGAPAPGKTPAAQPGTGAGKAVPAASHPEASAAEKWARENPNDPRAAAILKKLGKQ